MRKLVIFLIISVAFLGFGIDYIKDFDVAVRLSSLEKKKIVMIFEMKTCGYCQLLNETTLKDEKVGQFLSINYITVVVFADENPELFAEFKVRATPTMWFFQTSSGTPTAITYVPGYLPADLFLKVLKYVYKLPKESFKDYVKKNDDFMGEKLLIKVGEEDAMFVLKHDPLAVLVKTKDQYAGWEKVYITRDEKLAEWLHKRAYRVLLIQER